MFSAPVRHQIDVRTVVPVGEKCLLPAVAALGYVMRIVGYNDSCDSGNGLDYRRSCRIGSRNKYSVPGITLCVCLDHHSDHFSDTQLNVIQEVAECPKLGSGVLELNSPYNNEYDIIRQTMTNSVEFSMASIYSPPITY